MAVYRAVLRTPSLAETKADHGPVVVSAPDNRSVGKDTQEIPGRLNRRVQARSRHRAGFQPAMSTLDSQRGVEIVSPAFRV